MDSSTKIKCNNCRSNVIPRLIYQQHSSFIANRKTEHVCPICGDTMYETGGELTGLGKVTAKIFILVIALFLLFNFNKSDTNFIYYAAIGLIVVLWVRKRNKS